VSTDGAPDTTAAVHTSYEEHGRRNSVEPLVLLHGGLSGGSGCWRAQIPAFAVHHQLYAPDRRGHGRTPDVDGPYSYEAMADETVVFLEQVVRRPSHLLGFSDGGNVALHVARDRPDLVRKIVVIGANFHHDGLHPSFLASLGRSTDPPAIVAAKVEQMWRTGPTMAPADLRRIEAEVLVMVGDDDCITHAHTVTLFESLRHGQLAVIPGTSHLVAEEKPSLVNRIILEFLADGRPRRSWPMRFTD
jgi:pimeloyl-ACP methyl ester carboxylesterase